MIREYFKNLSRGRSGNVAITFALSLLPILFSVGITMDYSEISRIESRLQETADIAALYAIKGLKDGGYDEQEIDQLAYDNVMPNYGIKTSKVDIKLDVVADTIKINGDATVTFNVEPDKTDLVVPEELYYRAVTARLTK